MHWKTLLKKPFSTCIRLHFLPPSFYFFLRFCSYESTEDKLSLFHIWTLVRRFAGVFCKSFLPPLTIIGKLRAVCWGISQKFYKKFLLNQGHKNRKVDCIFKNFIFYDNFFRENYPSIFPRTQAFVLQPVYKIFNEFSQKNPCDFGRLSRHDLRTDFYPDYLIFSRFYSKIVSQ